jgi:hypothetical protein
MHRVSLSNRFISSLWDGLFEQSSPSPVRRYSSPSECPASMSFTAGLMNSICLCARRNWPPSVVDRLDIGGRTSSEVQCLPLVFRVLVMSSVWFFRVFVILARLEGWHVLSRSIGLLVTLLNQVRLVVLAHLARNSYHLAITPV